MSFRIEHDKQPQRFLKHLNKNLIRRVMDKVDELILEDPVPP